MAQHDYNLENAPGAAFRSDLNGALNAVATLNSGPTAPVSPFANMAWFDTTTNLLKMRNATNSAWITIASKSGDNWIPYRLGAALGTASVQPDERYAHRANNLSDLANAGTARNNLGLGTAAVRASEDTLTNGSNLPDGAAVIEYVAQQLAAIPEPVAWTTLPEVPTDQNLGSHLVTGIPTSATEIEIILRDVQLGATQFFLIQLGNSGGVVTSGYAGSAKHSEANFPQSNSGGFVIANNSAPVSIRMRIIKNAGDVWDYSYVGGGGFGNNGSTAGGGFSGSIPNVDRIMLQRVSSNQFLGGVMIVRYR